MGSERDKKVFFRPFLSVYIMWNSVHDKFQKVAQYHEQSFCESEVPAQLKKTFELFYKKYLSLSSVKTNLINSVIIWTQ